MVQNLSATRRCSKTKGAGPSTRAKLGAGLVPHRNKVSGAGSSHSKDEERLILQRLRRSREDSVWLNRHYNRLKLRYPDEFVAVFKKKTVAHNKDLKKLMGKLEKEYPGEAGNIAVEFVSPKKVELIL